MALSKSNSEAPGLFVPNFGDEVLVDIPVWVTSDASVVSISSTVDEAPYGMIPVWGRPGVAVIAAIATNDKGNRIISEAEVWVENDADLTSHLEWVENGPPNVVVDPAVVEKPATTIASAPSTTTIPPTIASAPETVTPEAGSTGDVAGGEAAVVDPTNASSPSPSETASNVSSPSPTPESSTSSGDTVVPSSDSASGDDGQSAPPDTSSTATPSGSDPSTSGAAPAAS